MPEAARATAREFQTFGLVHVLVALVVIVTAARAMGYLFTRFLGQPRVIGEVVAGILLGPSLLGRVAPDVSDVLLPGGAVPFLGFLAQLGVILFMFLVGLELDLGLLRNRTRAAVAISHSSIVVPFLLGSLLALWLYPQVATADVSFTHFALFLGVSLSVTAFPVLARIVTEQGLKNTTIGTLALTCAAVDDVTAWCLLALVTGAVSAQAGAGIQTLFLAVGYIGAILLVGPPLGRRLAASSQAHAIVFIGILLSALATEAIGIHALFGAFLVGVVIPRGSALAEGMRQRVEDVALVLLLPVFFAYTGLKTSIQLVSGAAAWTMCLVILLAACAGKIGGSMAAARFAGLSWKDGARIGVLMNTRGLVELVVLNLGLDLGIISPTLFAMLVIMAVVTTLATTPLLQLIGPDSGERAGSR